MSDSQEASPVDRPEAAASRIQAVAAGRSGVWIVVALFLAALLPFLDKAYTIDDTLFLELAEHLQEDAADFYGFEVNWYGSVEEMHRITMNPPLTGYWLAAVTALAGWSERVVHAFFLLPAALLAAATYFLARRFTGRPVWASAIGLLTPVVLVSSTNVMCDTTMLALWCLCLLWWVKGIDEERVAFLLGACVVAGLTALTKYFGVALLPLMAAYAWRRRGVGVWLAWLMIPVVVLAAYQLATHQMYGRGLFFNAARYAVNPDGIAKDYNPLNRTLTGFSFAGGCVLPALLLAPLLWSRRVVLIGVAGGLILGFALPATPILASLRLDPFWSGFDDLTAPSINHTIVWQFVLFILGGVSLVGLTVAELRRSRDENALLLAFWLAGTFVFAAFLNWVNNGRSNLPLAPVAGILIVRQLDHRGLFAGARAGLAHVLAVAGIALAFLVARADYQWAGENRKAARWASRFLKHSDPLWFQGHWGFQYYMERHGARAFDFDRDAVLEGQLLVVPTNNSFTREPLIEVPRPAAERVSDTPAWIHTLAHGIGAGFYASNIGPLPWVIGKPWPPDIFRVWRAPAGGLRFMPQSFVGDQ